MKPEFKKGTIRVVNRWHKKKHPNVVSKNIGRKSPVGNPFKIDNGRDGEFCLEINSIFLL